VAKQTGWVYVRKNKTKPGEPGRWSEKKKLEAVTTYLATGNLNLTGRIINIPDITMDSWRNSDWWPELIAQVQQQGDVKLSSRLEKVVEKSLDAVNEIIENGDYLYDSKRGKVVRVPAKLRDVHRVASDLIDKQTILRKQIKPQQQNDETTDGKLKKLADAFAEFASGIKKTIKEVDIVVEGEFEELPPNYVDALKHQMATDLAETYTGEFEDAVHDTGPERLQEGTSLGTQEETKPSEGQGQTQFSSFSGSEANGS
jgi:hypothetical protein